MAEMFFELFLKLKGTEFVSPLPEGSEAQTTNYLLPENPEQSEG